MKAIILAGGKGTRLLPITLNTPKPLIEIRGKKILENILDEIPEEISLVYIIVSHLKEQIISFIEEKKYHFKIEITEQDKDQKGTLGALLSIKNKIEEDEYFMVLNGDDLQKKEDLQNFTEKKISFGVSKKTMPGYYRVESDEDGFLSGLKEKEEGEDSWMVATGVYTLSENFFSLKPEELKNGELGIPQTLLKNKDTYKAFIVEQNYWYPINSHDDLKNHS